MTINPTHLVPETPEQPVSITLETPEDSQDDRDKVVDLVASVTARQWLEARRALEMSTEEIMDDDIAMMIVAATAKGAEDSALWQWDKFADMTPEQLSDFIGVEVVADSKSDDAPVASQ